MQQTFKTEPTGKPKSSIILTIILLSYVMIVIDNSIVITGLPKIRDEFSFTLAGLSWVSSAYALMFGGLLLLSARAGDMFGRKKMLCLGLAIFSASSFAIGLSPSAEFLVSARVVQGIGASILAPSTLALLQATFPPGHERSRAISFYAAAGGLSASIGLVLGGLLADLLSWRVGFLINVPIGIALILAARRYITETDRHTGKLDIPGALLSSVGMAGVVYGTVSSADNGWSNVTTLASFIGGLVLIAVFIWIESRTKNPLMPLRLFFSRERSGAYAARFLYIGAAMGFFFYSTQFMQSVLHYTPIEAGFAFVPSMIVNFLVALYAPKYISRHGGRRILMLSLLVAFVGMLMLSQLGQGSTFIGGLLLPTLLIGFGMGGAMGPLTTSGISNVAHEDAGAASGVVNVMHQVGGALGLSILVTAAEIGSDSLKGTDQLLNQISNAFTAGTVLIAAALVLVLLFMPHHKKGS
ncbi:MFS transporter [Pantoea sp. Cy-640]|uniref:MFS transporter n=1 Tax=Pantoea sp. Cy-640 TaxID=2608353 RepID=UPI00352D8D26